jgi:transcriptional regulator with XRE-family HTH domain
MFVVNHKNVILTNILVFAGRGFMNIGDRIKKIRAGVSREKFSALTGISKNTLVNYEMGKSSPDAAYLNKLLELFPDINPRWLLLGDANMKCHLNEEILESVIEVIDELLGSISKKVTPGQKARLIIAMYELSCEGGKDDIDRKTALRLVRLATAA